MDGKRKLLVLATNELVRKGLIDLVPTNSAARNDDNVGFVETDIAGHNAIIQWSDIGHDELRISIWWKYDHSKHPQANHEGNAKERFQTSQPLANRHTYSRFVGVCASGWLERLKGPHLQGYGSSCIFDTYMRRGEKEALERLPVPNPAGYAAEGKFYM